MPKNIQEIFQKSIWNIFEIFKIFSGVKLTVQDLDFEWAPQDWACFTKRLRSDVKTEQSRNFEIIILYLTFNLHASES